MQFADRFSVYWQLSRADRPIGSLLLLWPTLWALLIAAGGLPGSWNLLVFVAGVFLMRAAGCVINDYADRHFDGHVRRTSARPLPSGRASEREALLLFVALGLAAFALVLTLDPFTIRLSLVGLLLAVIYPFMKRYTHLPQLFLGAAFSWSIPMAFAAERGSLSAEVWLLYLANLLWTVAYDTLYAMVDRDDDLKVGIKSTAILFGRWDKRMVGVLQLLFLLLMAVTGIRLGLGGVYYWGLMVAAGLLVRQQWLIRKRDRDACFQAFLNNNYVGMAVFLGLAASYL